VEVPPVEEFGMVEFGTRYSVQVHHFHGRVRLKIVLHNVQGGSHDIQTLYSYPVTSPGEEAIFSHYDRSGSATQIDIEELLRWLHDLPSTDNSILSFLSIMCRSDAARHFVCLVEQAICACELWWGWGCPMESTTLECYKEVGNGSPDNLQSQKQRDQWVFANEILATREAAKKAENR